MPSPRLSSLIRDTHLEVLSKTKEGRRGALKETINRMVKTEFQKMMSEAADRGKEIGKKLNDLRETLIKEGKINWLNKGSGTVTRAAIAERRIPIATVSELIDVPINELVLFFLNGERISEGLYDNDCGCRYGAGNVYFYDIPKAGA